MNTITTAGELYHMARPCMISDYEVKCGSTFPQDYDFNGQPIQYVCGMCVPPVMMAQIATRVYNDILSKLD